MDAPPCAASVQDSLVQQFGLVWTLKLEITSPCNWCTSVQWGSLMMRSHGADMSEEKTDTLAKLQRYIEI